MSGQLSSSDIVLEALLFRRFSKVYILIFGRLWSPRKLLSINGQTCLG